MSLACSLRANCESRLNESFDLFKVEISLTDAGEKDYLKVMEIVYMFIN